MLNEPITHGGIRYVQVPGGYVALTYYEGYNEKVLGPHGIDPESWWENTLSRVNSHTDDVVTLLKERDRLHTEIDGWYAQNPAPSLDSSEYPAYLARHKDFLFQIGYLKDEGPDFEVETQGVDPEIAAQAGAQLVVPLKIARYALNAVNARWGSLYDALYGSDMIPQTGQTRPWRKGRYNPHRGQAVIDFAKEFLDQTVALDGFSHKDVIQYQLDEDADGTKVLVAQTEDGRKARLKVPAQFVGYKEDANGQLSSIVLRHNGSHLEIKIDRQNAIGHDDPAGVCDIDIEAALTVILDGEDSVEASSPKSKLLVHTNLAGILDGTLKETVAKGGKSFERSLNPDRHYKSANGADGERLTLPGRARILIRNVGIHLFTDIVLDENRRPVSEAVFDIYTAGQIAANNIQSDSGFRNSEGSIYFVQPKLQGDDEVTFLEKVVRSSEGRLGLLLNTIKIGLMDEERRTTLLLKRCIRALKKCVFFINTGFLDRTGSEIYTNMKAGAFMTKAEIKAAPWLQAYEWWSVATGILCKLPGHAQIGKGMWDAPTRMREMYEKKRAHSGSGANTAWVPSPTAATIFAMLWHLDDAYGKQQSLEAEARGADREAIRDQIMQTALDDKDPVPEKVQRELNSNVQSKLGYVVRWIDQGIGCSSVPDIDDTLRMEDLATLRIGRNIGVNQQEHDVVSKDMILDSMRRMAIKVDEQNVGRSAMLLWRVASIEVGSRKLGQLFERAFQFLWDKTARDTNYMPMSTNFENSFAVNAVRCLLFKDEADQQIFDQMRTEASDRFFNTSAYDYTELVLRHFRRKAEEAYGGERPPTSIGARLALTMR